MSKANGSAAVGAHNEHGKEGEQNEPVPLEQGIYSEKERHLQRKGTTSVNRRMTAEL